MSSSPADLLKQIPLPSIERPFGIELWPLFDQAFTAVKGYHPQDFDFQPHHTPMSTMKESALAILTYYIVIFSGRELMRNRPAMKLNTLFMIHNFFFYRFRHSDFNGRSCGLHLLTAAAQRDGCDSHAKPLPALKKKALPNVPGRPTAKQSRKVHDD